MNSGTKAEMALIRWHQVPTCETLDLMSSPQHESQRGPWLVRFLVQMVPFAAFLFVLMIFTQDALDAPIATAIGSLIGGSLYAAGVVILSGRKRANRSSSGQTLRRSNDRDRVARVAAE